MIRALHQFRINLQRVRELSQTITAIDSMTTNAIDLSDLLRSQMMLAVSALDHFIHELTRLGMLKIHQNNRIATEAYLRYQVPLKITKTPTVITGIEWLDDVIKERHSWHSFQHPDKIAEAIRLISSEPLWQRISDTLGISVRDIKMRLTLIVERRDKIAHEADIDPTNPGVRWPINSTMVNEAIDFIEIIAETIYQVTI